MEKILTKKLRAIFLILITAAVLFAVSCGDEPDVPGNGSGTPGVPGTNGTQEAALTEADEYEFPEVDFEGYVMRLLTISDEVWAITAMDAESQTGEPVNDAIFRRNRMVEEALNIVIQEIPAQAQAHDMLARSVRAGLDEYDLMFAHARSSAPLASLGYYINLHDINSLNLDRSYWDQNAIEAFEIMGKLYFMTSDANVMTFESIWALYFNTRMHEDLGLDCPYTLVREGRWTIDVMHGMARAAARDLDGDGVFTEADQWGIASTALAFIQFLTCQGEPLIGRDADNLPVLVEPNERFVRAYSNVRDMLDATAGLHLASGIFGRTAYSMFMDNMSLFLSEVLGVSRIFREMTADFGLLPHPKFDENQPTYLNATAHVVPILSIPITNPDPERTGVFIDALTALTATTVTPAYYTISLEGKFTRDEDSVEMLDIMRSNITFDLALIYNWDNFHRTFRDHITSPDGENPMTVFEIHGDRVTAQIQETIEFFRER